MLNYRVKTVLINKKGQAEASCIIKVSADYLLVFGNYNAIFAIYSSLCCQRTLSFPVRRSADLQSAVKKCPNLFRLCGFAIRNIQFVLFGVVVGGLQIPRF